VTLGGSPYSRCPRRSTFAAGALATTPAEAPARGCASIERGIAKRARLLGRTILAGEATARALTAFDPGATLLWLGGCRRGVRVSGWQRRHVLRPGARREVHAEVALHALPGR